MEREPAGMVVDEEVGAQVWKLLAGLTRGPQRSERVEALKRLFWEELNYDRANQELAIERGQLDYLADSPLLLASGADGAFHVVYLHLKQQLSLSRERMLITKLLRDHVYALFIFSNAEQNHWHFVNVKQERDNAKRRIYRRITVGPEERLRTATERISLLDLKRLDPRLFGISALDIQNAHDSAFDVEAVTRKFHQEYKTLFDVLQKDLYQQTGDQVWAHDYALQFLNRCMFLYFIQRKHWLSEDDSPEHSEFLKRFWNGYRQSLESGAEPNSFFERWLKILFFEAFNNRFSGHYRHFPAPIFSILQQAPYLNGGLFKENELDTHGDFTVSDQRFHQVLTFFERYNFTIAEDSPLDQEVAVDPEMIGKVYESLVNVSDGIDEQSDAGIFYTPRVEIDLMCRLTLVDYLANHLGQQDRSLLYEMVFALEPEDKETIDKLFATKRLWQPVYNLLKAVTVVDPACGSGAFLVGMLYVLDDLLARAEHHLPEFAQQDEQQRAYFRKKEIIGRSLYGVDVMGWALRVAELRLWLTLIVDANFTREELHVRNEPLLPYFTFKVRRGDSLVQMVGSYNFGLQQKLGDLPLPLRQRVTQLKAQKQLFYENSDERTLHTEGDVRQAERNLFISILHHQQHENDEQQKKLQRQIAQRTERQLSLEGMETRTAEQLPLDVVLWQQELTNLQAKKPQLEQTLTVIMQPEALPFVWNIAFVEIFANKGFDIVIGNPPYVRQEQIVNPSLPQDERQQKAQKDAYKAMLQKAVGALFPHFFGYNARTDTFQRKLDGKSDLYIYFYLYGLALLRERGVFSFITSNSWLDVGYGAELQEFLLKHCHIKLILDNEMRRSFASASVNTVITLFSPPDEESEWGLNETARFVMCRVPFEQLLSSTLLKEIEGTSTRHTFTECRVNAITQRQLLEEGSPQPDEQPKIVSKPAYTGNKWGGKYLRAPDIYWTLIEKGRAKLVRLGDIAEVRFGIKTGANDFFYLDNAAIRQWGIEAEFLRPVIKSPRECKSIQINANALKFKIFICHKSKAELKGTAALKYIEWGESKGFQRRPSCAGRSKWWDLGERRIPPIISPSSISDMLRTFGNDTVLADKRLYEIYPYTPKEAVHLATNSTLSTLFLELGSRTGLGEGLLDLTVYELADCLIAVPQETVQVKEVLYKMAERNLLPIQEEIKQADRHALDSIIFDALNLTQGERDAVYEAVSNLVGLRLNKAKSLDGQGREQAEKKEQKKRIEAVNNITGIWMNLPAELDEERV